MENGGWRPKFTQHVGALLAMQSKKLKALEERIVARMVTFDHHMSGGAIRLGHS